MPRDKKIKVTQSVMHGWASTAERVAAFAAQADEEAAEMAQWLADDIRERAGLPAEPPII